jgi:hypothetical protein
MSIRKLELRYALENIWLNVLIVLSLLNLKQMFAKTAIEMWPPSLKAKEKN